jgi:hypothetical protein
MTEGSAPAPNPKRVAAGRRNHALRRGLTPEGRARLRASALEHQPWRYATGPRTPAGKAKAAANGKYRQAGPRSVRATRREMAEVREFLRALQSLRADAETFRRREALPG